MRKYFLGIHYFIVINSLAVTWVDAVLYKKIHILCVYLLVHGVYTPIVLIFFSFFNQTHYNTKSSGSIIIKMKRAEPCVHVSTFPKNKQLSHVLVARVAVEQLSSTGHTFLTRISYEMSIIFNSYASIISTHLHCIYSFIYLRPHSIYNTSVRLILILLLPFKLLSLLRSKIFL